MRKARLTGAGVGLAMLLVTAIAGAGCGGEGPEATAAAFPNAKEVRRCMFEGGAHTGEQKPALPKGFPAEAEAVNISGASEDHVTVFVARRPVFTPQIAKGFDEYKAKVILGGRALLLLPRILTKQTEDLAVSCAEGHGVPAGAPDPMSTIPSASQFKQCVVEDGGKLSSKVPDQPKGFPSEVESAITVGPGSARIVAYLSPTRSVFNQDLAKRFDVQGEYQARVIYGGKGLLLLDPGIAGGDRRVAMECVEA